MSIEELKSEIAQYEPLDNVFINPATKIGDHRRFVDMQFLILGQCKGDITKSPAHLRLVEYIAVLKKGQTSE